MSSTTTDPLYILATAHSMSVERDSTRTTTDVIPLHHSEPPTTRDERLGNIAS